MAFEQEKNPLHRIIDLLIIYEIAFTEIHHSDTEAKFRDALSGWNRIHPSVWNGYKKRDDAIRALSDPAKAWLAKVQSRFLIAIDIDLVEDCALELTGFAINPHPMARPEIYSENYSTKSDLLAKWDKQGGFIFSLGERISKLRELSARAGLVWKNSSEPFTGSELIVDDLMKTQVKEENFRKQYLEKIQNFKEILCQRARGGAPAGEEYIRQRAELVDCEAVRVRLPSFVLNCFTIQDFWLFIKNKFGKYNERTEYIRSEFFPILSWLESGRDSESIPISRSPFKVINVLLLSANFGDAPLSIDEEFRAIDAKIQGSEHREHVKLIKHGAVQLQDVSTLLMRYKPEIVHFSGHGALKGIVLTGPNGEPSFVPPETLAKIFQVLKDNIRVVLLNSCNSEPQAEAIVSVIDCAVGMSDQIRDDAAIAFAAAFYEALGFGRSIQDAFDLAIIQISSTSADISLPRLLNRPGINPADIRLVNPQRPQ